MPTPAALSGPTAAILIIGEEILSGKVEEENARYLVQELRALGVQVRRIEFLPDIESEIATSRAARCRSGSTTSSPRAGWVPPTTT